MTKNDAPELPYPRLLLKAEEIDRDAVFSRLNTLNMLHHLHLTDVGSEEGRKKGPSLFHRQPGKMGTGTTEDRTTATGTLIGSLETTIDIAEHFHSFLVENKMALDEVKSNINALVFGRVSDVAGMAEEYITKEDPLKDILMQMVPFVLSTFSEKSYISSAAIGHKGILRTYSLYIYSAVYSYVKDTKKKVSKENAEEISRTMEELYHTLDTAVGNPQGLYLFAVLFLILYNLRAQEILNMLNHESEKMNTEG